MHIRVRTQEVKASSSHLHCLPILHSHGNFEGLFLCPSSLAGLFSHTRIVYLSRLIYVTFMWEEVRVCTDISLFRDRKTHVAQNVPLPTRYRLAFFSWWKILLVEYAWWRGIPFSSSCRTLPSYVAVQASRQEAFASYPMDFFSPFQV